MTAPPPSPPSPADLTRRELLAAGAIAVTAGSAAAAAPPARAAAPSVLAEPRIDIVCARCGGNNVTRDAWAEWDVAAQNWTLGAVYDQGYCHDCDAEARLEEMIVAASAPLRSG